MKVVLAIISLSIIMSFSCSVKKDIENTSKVRLVVIDPQHFHAALVQKTKHHMLEDTVYLFAELDSTTNGYKSLIKQYNTRSDNPTNWQLVDSYGSDFLQQAVAQTDGDLVVLAGDNKKKIDYITESINSNKAVFADKPLVINSAGYSKLESILNETGKGNVLLYDIMTERFDIKNIIVKSLINSEIFSGGFDKTANRNLIEINSIHHFSKQVSGKTLIRPSMFFDVERQGEGLVDVTTHYIDLVQWILSDNRSIDIKEDIKLIGSERWSTVVSKEDFQQITTLNDYPEVLKKTTVKNNELQVFSNGKLNYSLFDIPVSLQVQWNVKAKEGRGDQFQALFHMNNCLIKIAPNEQGKSSIFITPKDQSISFEETLGTVLTTLKDYPDLDFERIGDSYKILIPDQYYLSHEDHFAKVLDLFITYKQEGEIPDWEKSFILAKYYLTTEGLKKAITLN